ncbi:MAG: glutamate--tRNA ligase family protein [Pseudomonadota bacterium]
MDDENAVAWQDLGRGPVHFEPGHLSDPVLLRADGRPLYTLTSVVDDKELAVSHIIRGADHIANTAVQCQLFEALGAEVPTMAHLPLMVGQDGHNLSKRLQSLSVREMRANGIMPRALGLYLGALGMSHVPEAATSMQEFADSFDLAHFGKASPRFDDEALHHWNTRVLRTTPLDDLQPIFQNAGIGAIDEAGWQQILTHIESIDDVKSWWPIYYQDEKLRADLDDAQRAFAAKACDVLPDHFESDDDYQGWIARIKKETGAKGKNLFLPLRLALTGQPSGPELVRFTQFLGRERVLVRLKNQ